MHWCAHKLAVEMKIVYFIYKNAPFLEALQYQADTWQRSSKPETLCRVAKINLTTE